MACAICGGDLKKARVKLDLWTNDELTIIEDVPAEVCQQCGEKYLSSETTKKIDKLIMDRPKSTKKLEVPVLSLEAKATSG